MDLHSFRDFCFFSEKTKSIEGHPFLSNFFLFFVSFFASFRAMLNGESRTSSLPGSFTFFHPVNLGFPRFFDLEFVLETASMIGSLKLSGTPNAPHLYDLRPFVLLARET